MGSDIVVNVTNVVKRYKQTEVVKPLSFSIKKGRQSPYVEETVREKAR